jgi:hypothetical protein
MYLGRPACVLQVSAGLIVLNGRAVRRTCIDGLYGRRNVDPVTVPSQRGDLESKAVFVRHIYGQAQIDGHNWFSGQPY